MTPAAWLFLVLFAVLTISITIVANRPAPSGGPTPRENGPPPSLEKFAAPAHTAPPWTIAGIADCSAGSLSIGNATDQEITFISGKFVVERHYSAKETEWHTDTELGGFFAELVPPHGWRRSVSYGPSNISAAITPASESCGSIGASSTNATSVMRVPSTCSQ